MRTHWYLFCPRSGLGFLLMEFPWLFLSHLAKMLLFSNFSLLISPLTLSSLAHSPSYTSLFRLFLLFSPPRSLLLSPPASQRHHSTIKVFQDVEVSSVNMCIYYVCTNCFRIQFGIQLICPFNDIQILSHALNTLPPLGAAGYLARMGCYIS